MIKFDKVVKIINNDNTEKEYLSKSLGISMLTSKILLNRGINQLEEAEVFLNPALSKLYDPFLLKDMDEAVTRICEAVDKKENIWIYGDYDVDGVTSTSILMIFLKKIGIEPKYYIPDRMTEGYGLNKNAIDYINDEGGQLIITVDCGITSFEVVEHCNQKGIDIIITDHHQCIESIPDALAVINPNRNDCKYPFKKLAGVGVAFKLIQALSKSLDTKINYNEILPIVAIGTVADVVSLTGENRIIVKNGLDIINSSSNFGVKALIEVTGLKEKQITSGHIGFVLGPRINAGGRIGLAKYGVELFIADSIETAYTLAKKLDAENVKRQKIEQEILKSAIKTIENNYDTEKERVLVVSGEDWHHGVIGIVSSRITEKYYRPSIVISIEENEARGSARSISSFDMYESLSKCKDLFIKFGGHKQAAGLSLYKENICYLRNKINAIADEVLSEEDLIPQIVVDSEINSFDISLATVEELDMLKPFGVDNPSPLFLLKNAKIKSINCIGKEKNHLKLFVEKNGVEFDCIGFRLGEYSEKLNPNDTIDIVASLEINEYMSKKKVQLNIKEIMLAFSNNSKIDKKYSDSLLNSFSYNTNVSDHTSFNNLKIHKNIDRVHYIIEKLKNDDGIMVLINNFYILQELLSEVQLEGRSIIKKTEISYNFSMQNKSNCIIINPILQNIDFRQYKDIYLLGLSFDNITSPSFVDLLGERFLNIFLDSKDIDLNTKVVDDIVPTLGDLRAVYKSFLNKNSDILRINIEKYISFLNNNSFLKLNEMKLRLAIEILNDCNLLDFKFKNEDYYIKLNNKPKNKIDIENVQKFKYLNYLKNNILNNYNYINSYIEEED